MSKIYSKNKDAKELEIPFTMTPNFCLDTMAMRKPAENCVYFAIVRQTVGYLTPNGSRKKSAPLSISRLMQLTGLSRQGVLNSRKSLFKDGWILFKRGEGMTSYAIVDRYEEFKRIQESTELTSDSQLSRQDQSTELTSDSQLSRHIKEKEIKFNKEIEIKENEIVPLPTQLKEFAKNNNLVYEMNTREDQKAQSKFVTELSQTNEQILAQVERLKPILKDSSCDWWSKTNSFGFNFLLKNWGRIDAWHNANKSNVVTFPKYDMDELRKEGWGY
ncbi:MAG: hypothetical protein IPL26_12810 [Leptospiraceae bacterium]|nr:hypothetical protein [Leptospiraceae bacterium]